MSLLRNLIRRASGREGRNEQRKLRGNIANAVAITLIAGAMVGPFVNPALEATLSVPERILMLLGGAAMHLLASRAVRDMEDK